MTTPRHDTVDASSGNAGYARRHKYPGGGVPIRADMPSIEVDQEERSTIHVLIVDDERSLRESCASLLTAQGFPVTLCASGLEGLKMVRERRFQILLLDLYLPDVTGLDILKAALETNPDCLVIVMTGNPSVESSVKALREGAWDYLPKPFSATHFNILLGRASHAVVVARESRARADEAPEDDESRLLGASRAFLEVLHVARQVAATDASVFITGESGAGKEVIAQYIHRHSRRSSRELVPLNCAAIPEALVESEMFGHVEGAFTGAVREKKGLLETAHGGTLFLDELTQLPLPTQAKLLRVLQDGVIRRVGSNKTDAVVNVRFIAATNDDPLEAVREQRLRRDLFYRLRVVPIYVPPLRDRPEDIPVLAKHFLHDFWSAHRGSVSDAPHFADEALAALRRVPWPGNVRELRNVIEHLAVIAEPEATLRPEDIPFFEEASEEAATNETLWPRAVLELPYHEARERVLGDFGRLYVSHIVERANGNISDAARQAGVDRTTLYRLMEKHGTHPTRTGSDTDSDGQT